MRADLVNTGLNGRPRSNRPRRPGNALILAIALIVLLAMIGSAFVLVSRMDRQSTRGTEEAMIGQAALDTVLVTIQKQMAAGLFDDPVNGPLKSDLYDYAGTDAHDAGGNIIARGDYWLAAIEPVHDVTSGKPYYWPHVSDLTGPGSKYEFPNLGDPPVANAADADGDGWPDSFFHDLPGISSAGKTVRYAVRIIDNSAMANVNTSWTRASGMTARADDPDSHGEFLHQFDLSRLLKRTGVSDSLGDAVQAHDTLMNGQNLASANHDVQSVLYQDLAANDYHGLSVRPFGVEDELELRNRFTINTAVQTRLETAMAGSLGRFDPNDPTGWYRILPFPAEYPLETWYRQLSDTLPSGSTLRPDQRRLLTTNSAGREIRTATQPSSAAEQFLDMVNFVSGANLGGPGRWRKVNINSVLQTWFDGSKPAAQRQAAVLRLVKAIEASGLTVDQGFQFAANLVDFVDADSLPTVFAAGSFVSPDGTIIHGPGRTIFGTEQQPVITELYNEENSSGDCVDAAIEIYNPPYNGPIDLTGWELRLGSSWTLALGAEPVEQAFPAGALLVYRRSGVILVRPDGGADTLPARKTTANGEITFSDANGELELARTFTVDGNTFTLVADRSTPAAMAAIVQHTQGQHSAHRGLADPTSRLAPWACTRNVFAPGGGTLGMLTKVTTATPANDPVNKSGVPIRVDNRGPIADPANPGLGAFWRVRGPYELGRVLLVGNPSLGDAAVHGTITDAVAALPCETFQDLSGDGNWGQYTDPGSGMLLPEPVIGDNGNGVYDPYYVNEFPYDAVGGKFKWLRLNFVREGGLPAGVLDPAVELWKHVSLVSRTDDGLDNDNADSDGDASTGADDLSECRLAGRINVNTASEAVLKAAFPALTVHGMDPATGLPGAGAALSADELDKVSTWFAKAVIYLRNHDPAKDAINAGPFTSLADLFSRLDKFDNPTLDTDGRRSSGPSSTPVLDMPAAFRNTPHVLRFGALVDAAKGNTWGATLVGDCQMTGDSEERDWIFTRMTNLLDVRSDVFTAYILIRVQNQANPNDFTEQRYEAILDRSNVFLPETRAGNGSDDSGEMSIFDPTGALYGAAGANDPEHFDRRYVLPKTVALRQTPDAR